MRYTTDSLSSLGSQVDPQTIINEAYEVFDLELEDSRLVQMLVNSLDSDISHWNEKPWKLEETDKENIEYLLGYQVDDKLLLNHQIKYVDNRLFASTRAIVAYVFGQTAKPEITPSKGEDEYLRLASQMELGIYQHAVNHDVNAQFRLAGKNLIVRKRGYVKLRFDPEAGPFGDIITENVDPADIVVDRFAGYGGDPNRIYHRQKCTVEELCAKFPDKEKEILNQFGIVRGTYKQMSRMVTYWECWFTYYEDKKRCQGLCWFIPNSEVILGKMKNPNWIDKGSEKQQKIANLTTQPVKPFINLNYFNTGRSYIDETCLIEQARPQQDLLNKRGRQIWENADYSNPRTLVDKRVMDQSDATKFVNKHPKTIGLVDTTDTGNDISKAVMQIPAQMLPDYVVTTLYDSRNEIDTLMGTPAIFRGEQPQNQSKTLGQDLLIKQQAGALQDDLITVVHEAYAKYYMYLLQMLKVYMTDDYWVLTKGSAGQYSAIKLNSEKIDTNVKVGVQTNSTLPLDKESQKSTAEMLATAGLVDPLTLFRDLGLPDPEDRAERLEKYKLDELGYMQSVEQQLFNEEADIDLTLVINNKEPEERDDYSEDYLNYFNHYLTTNRFRKLKPDQQARVTAFVGQIADNAAQTAHLKGILNPAGMLNPPELDPNAMMGMPPGAPQPGQQPQVPPQQGSPVI